MIWQDLKLIFNMGFWFTDWSFAEDFIRVAIRRSSLLVDDRLTILNHLTLYHILRFTTSFVCVRGV